MMPVWCSAVAVAQADSRWLQHLLWLWLRQILVGCNIGVGFLNFLTDDIQTEGLESRVIGISADSEATCHRFLDNDHVKGATLVRSGLVAVHDECGLDALSEITFGPRDRLDVIGRLSVFIEDALVESRQNTGSP